MVSISEKKKNIQLAFECQTNVFLDWVKTIESCMVILLLHITLLEISSI